jgi:hypothetical protein
MASNEKYKCDNEQRFVTYGVTSYRGLIYGIILAKATKIIGSLSIRRDSNEISSEDKAVGSSNNSSELSFPICRPIA